MSEEAMKRQDLQSTTSFITALASFEHGIPPDKIPVILAKAFNRLDLLDDVTNDGATMLIRGLLTRFTNDPQGVVNEIVQNPDLLMGLSQLTVGAATTAEQLAQDQAAIQGPGAEGA